MNFEDLFKDMPEPRTTLTPMQHINRLKEIFELYYSEDVTHFEPGDLIIHKSPTFANTAFADNPAIFIRYLETPYNIIKNNTPYDIDPSGKAFFPQELDCIIGRMVNTVPDHVCFVEYLARSFEYKSL